MEVVFIVVYLVILNVIVDGVFVGGEDDYVVFDVVGEFSYFENFKDYLEFGELLGLIDM